MKNLLLGIITLCLSLLTLNVYIPEAIADVAGMSYSDLMMDPDFKLAVEQIVGNCFIDGGYVRARDGGLAYVNGASIAC